MFPAAFLHLCLNLASTVQSGLRMQSMMGYHLVGIVSDKREGCAGLRKEQLHLYFLCKQRRLAALSRPDECWVKYCITVCAENFMHSKAFKRTTNNPDGSQSLGAERTTDKGELKELGTKCPLNRGFKEQFINFSKMNCHRIKMPLSPAVLVMWNSVQIIFQIQFTLIHHAHVLMHYKHVCSENCCLLNSADVNKYNNVM